MFDLVPTIEAHAQENPLNSKRLPLYAPAGSTVAQIVALADLDPRHGLPIVILKRGLDATVVPIDAWGRVKPKTGTQVLIHYKVEAAAGALLASLVSAAAPTIAGSVFGLTAGTLGFSLATAAITVVGGLLVNALIPPPSQPRPGTQDPAQQTITGTQNRADPYGAIPKAMGRHRLFPKRGAKGYTVTTDEGEIEFRGRFILGWGPLCISDLRIGTTAIQDFDDIEVEFLNVDQTETLSRQPALSGITKAWRTGTQAMTLYPENVAEDGYAVEMVEWTAYVRRTRPGTESADVDITFPQGLFSQDLDNPSKRETRSHTFNFRYRAVGDVDWTSGGSMVVESKQNSQFRKTHKIVFPTPDEYDIEVTQASGNNPDSHHFDTSVLSAIRSFRPGTLPSHEDVAEIAIRVRATDQLNGQIDTLNCITHQMCRTWDGSAWTSPVVTRHPAWILADILQGAHMKRPVPDARIDLAELRSWAVDEPHWTCDLVVEGQTRVREIADIICPAGRAKFALTDLKYSVIREKPSDPIRQIITPRNSWGFKGRIVYPKTIHALRCIVKSERQQWQEDEVTVYNDGYNASNATEFETIRFPGVVLTEADTDQSNVYRLGRYHLADALLRYEQMSVSMDFEHLQVQRGDPVLVVHDVPSIGLGVARITAISASGSTLTSITLDDVFPDASGAHRVVLRTQYGVAVEFTATAPADASTRVWTYSSGTVDATDLTVGDLVTLQETTETKFEALVTNIRRGQNDTAVVTFVPRAPAVTTAADGTIPAYDPSLNAGPTGPTAPTVVSVKSDDTTSVIDRAGRAQPRILVRLEGRFEVSATATSVQLRWRPVGEQSYRVSQRYPVGTLSLFTEVLEEGVAYEVDVSSIDAQERRSDWVQATASLVASSAPSRTPKTPTNLSGLARRESVTITCDAVTDYTDDTAIIGEVTYRLHRGATDVFADSEIVETKAVPLFTNAGLAPATEYFFWVTVKTATDRESAASATLSITTLGDVSDGADGDRTYTGRLYYHILTASNPGLPDLTGRSFNESTGQFNSLPSNWEHDQPSVSITDTSVREWSCQYRVTVSGALAFPQSTVAVTNANRSNLVSAIQVTDNIESDNFNGSIDASGNITDPGTAGWANTRDGGNAVYNNIIARGLVDGGELNIEGAGGSRFARITPEDTGLILDIGTNSNGGMVRFLRTAGTGDVVSIRKENSGSAGLFVDMLSTGASNGIKVETLGGSGATAGDFENTRVNSGHAQLGLNSANGGYAFNAVQGGYFDLSGDGYNPFTGVHLAMISKGAEPEVGDILCDHRIVVGSISDSFGEVRISDGVGQCALGVLQKKREWFIPPAFIDHEATRARLSEEVLAHQDRKRAFIPVQKSIERRIRAIAKANCPGAIWRVGKFLHVMRFIRLTQPEVFAEIQRLAEGIHEVSPGTREPTSPVLLSDPSQYHADFDLVSVNSVGEGRINVCGRGGDITGGKDGDLIVSSDMPGKGMKQSDDVVRGNSVARARESVTFDHPDQVRQIACIYLCG